MATKKAKPLAKGKIKLVPIGIPVVNRDLEVAEAHTFQQWRDWVFEETGDRPKTLGIHLSLSAARTKVNNKGYLNAINCRNMFADGPNIDFLPQDSFGGKIEVWLQNVEEGDSFSVQFRVVCGYGGKWKVSCSDAMPFETNIVPVYQSIDCYIPPVSNNYGQVLIQLEPVFTTYGSWVFNDVIINKLNF